MIFSSNFQPTQGITYNNQFSAKPLYSTQSLSIPQYTTSSTNFPNQPQRLPVNQSPNTQSIPSYTSIFNLRQPSKPSVKPTSTPINVIPRPIQQAQECGVVRNASLFPWQITVFNQNGILICGGTIIGPNHVLTGKLITFK